MLDEWIASLPKALVAIVVLGGGIALMLILDPPKTVCDAQRVTFIEQQNRFLVAPVSEKLKSTLYQGLRDDCRRSPTPGGCLAFFGRIRQYLKDVATIPANCLVPILDAALAKPISEVLDLMIRVAWGDAMPTSYRAKLGWFDTVDMDLFCKLKSIYRRLYGEDLWSQFVEKYFKELPGAAAADREEVWARSILSYACAP